MSTERTPLVDHFDGSSGTDVSQPDSPNLETVTNALPGDPAEPRTEGDEEALESHQVIELTLFSERKAWIEEKIKLLEQMPPIEVFFGLDAVQSSAEEVPGLPTRVELKQWLAEHDAVEKETEIFDTGELKKLRNFTRAATQRNLSPEDTDLIELTLTTIYALDKLLHLLRDRSETLDLLGVRIAWEEQRISSWVDRRKIIADVQTFLESRAQWSSTVYDNPNVESATEDHRRGSVGSLASVSSDISISSPGFSRSTRFKLAEILSRDAAAFSARVSSLRHGSVAASGKILDKLIDHSRKPVPEVLLDEQDKLDELCVSGLENIGKFVLNVVMQWRKADEIYVETMKDHLAAQTLLSEIESAATQHPTAHALIRRLVLRGNPSSSASTFPRPTHPLCPQQSDFNESLAQTLSSEIKATTELIRSVESLAKQYKASYDAVSRVEILNAAVDALIATFDSIVDRLENGILSSEGDGTPPTLMSQDCLDPTRHSVFLALLPSLLEELSKADKTASELIHQVPVALLHLDFPGVDSGFKSNASAQLSQLSSIRERAQLLSRDMGGRVGRMRETRKIWTTMHVTMKELEVIRRTAVDEMDVCHWRQHTIDSSGAPLTPESPPSVSLPRHPPDQFMELESQLEQLAARAEKGVDIPLASLSTVLEVPLREHLSHSAQNLKSHFARVKRIIDLLHSLHKQTSAMNSIREQFNTLQFHIDGIMLRYESKIDGVINDTPAEGGATDADESLSNEYTTARSDAMAFVNGLSQKVPSLHQPHGGHVRSLEQKLDHYHLSQVGQELYTSTFAVQTEMDEAMKQVIIFKDSFDAITSGPDISEPLVKLATHIEDMASTHRSKLNRSMSIVHQILYRLQSSPARAISHLEARFVSWEASIDSLQAQVTGAQEAEATRLQKEREIEEACLEAERMRLAIEEAERVRVEKERLEEEESRRLEEARLVEEARLRQKEEERIVEEKRQQEENEKLRLNAIRLEEEARLEAEREKLLLEEAEKARMEKGGLLAERQLFARREQLAAEKAQLESEKLNKERNQAVKELEAVNSSYEEDVFGARITSADGPSITQETKDLLAVMGRLRKRLRSIAINEAARSQSNNSTLIGLDKAHVMRQELQALKQEVSSLPDNVDVSSVNVQLRSLRNDIEGSFALMDRVDSLAALCEALTNCDAALSDLLEHIDSFPATPLGPLSSSYIAPPESTPEEHLNGRLSFTRSTIDSMTVAFDLVKDDPRAQTEYDRILQTWSELEEMGLDRVTGKKSRPSSVTSTRSSGGRISQSRPPISLSNGTKTRKSSVYATLSVSSSTPRGRLNIPLSTPNSRRAFSGSDEPASRSTSRMSSRSTQQRATSGGSLYGTTFASRQRTTSLTSAAATPLQRREVSNLHTRSQTSTLSVKKRAPSPGLSDASRNGRSSTWSRAPRISFSSIPHVSTPPKRPDPPRKTYVANPKSKLDVAVGDVVNSLPIGINIEGVSGSWKDQSGKYWIGDQDPKLCFCRILRSQTVMVRVGGGWTELSKFIRDHFADSFRLLTASDSPGMHPMEEERWISSATLLEERETPPGPPRTPEPRGPLLPSFALSTPSGHSPHSLRSTPSTKGSPLTPLQFIRRAEPEIPFFGRPETPSKKPSQSRMSMNSAHTPARQSIWRP
ncbi:hypothetical protein BDP27DRAFT_1379987 [Rhodocollybia butyracea]|uniref:GAR domain-containing protein n=1 Tax=Rhodocollybia butyracea TaxID=206335 RepID=A0A9P5Q855_9AGAR|nr:hypothetical protein BDP27DRAFT_1379987 [Rhodocollybia butyracea]